MKNHIVLTKSDILNPDVNFYIRLRFYREFVTHQVCTLYKETPQSVISYIDTDKVNKMTSVGIGKLLGITRQTWSKYKDELVVPRLAVSSTDERFSLMPYYVFDSFLSWLNEVAHTIHAKEALLKFFCYMYFSASLYGGEFQLSQEQMAIELGTTVKLVNHRLKLLRDAGWLVRKGTYKFTGDKTWCYKYGIPEEYRASNIF